MRTNAQRRGSLAVFGVALCSLVAVFGAPDVNARAGAEEAAATAVFGNGDCLGCHEATDDFPLEAVFESVHEFAGCLDCHPGAETEEHMESGLTPGCADCHDTVTEALESSVHGEHGRYESEGIGAARWANGGCEVCHGSIHGLVSLEDPESPVHGSRLAETCGSCHGDADLAASQGIRLVQPLAAYTASVHAQAVAEGGGGALCSSCHGAHDILPAVDPRSKVHRDRVVATCGSCHEKVARIFATSVHGKAAAHGIQDSPVCVDCHGEHRILGPLDRDSPIYATNIPKLTCGRCHGDLRLSEKFGIDHDKVPAYADSFHGLASRSGSVTVASCASCHGVHDILPSSDPGAHTNAANLAETCGGCHPGAGARFAIGPVHVVPTSSEHAAVYWVRRLYLMLIFVTIGAMLAHNVLDLYRKAGRARPPGQGPPTERMSLGFRIAHALLAGSFIVLAYTGFALKYPESWWASALLHWEDSFGLRGGIHRAAAIVMLAAVGVHVVHLLLDRRARRAIGSMWPGRHDWVELKERVAWLVGRKSEPPPEPCLGYVEKAEYLAVVWGTAVMAVSGFLLWWEELTLSWLPSWVADVATAVHFYEAVLACLAILVWHFYSVIFDPIVYPMDPAWLTGKSRRKREPMRTARRASKRTEETKRKSS